MRSIVTGTLQWLIQEAESVQLIKETVWLDHGVDAHAVSRTVMRYQQSTDLTKSSGHQLTLDAETNAQMCKVEPGCFFFKVYPYSNRS